MGKYNRNENKGKGFNPSAKTKESGVNTKEDVSDDVEEVVEEQVKATEVQEETKTDNVEVKGETNTDTEETTSTDTESETKADTKVVEVTPTTQIVQKGLEEETKLTDKQVFILEQSKAILKTLDTKLAFNNLVVFLTVLKRYLANVKNQNETKLFLRELRDTLEIEKNYISLLAICNHVTTNETEVKVEKEFTYLLTILKDGVKENFEIINTFQREKLDAKLGEALVFYADIH